MMTSRERMRFRFQVAIALLLANAVILRWLEMIQ